MADDKARKPIEPPVSEQEIKANRPGNQAHLVSWEITLLQLSILFLAGMGFAAAFPAVNWSFVGWIGLIPLYWLLPHKRPLQAALYGLVWGYGWSVTSFFWLREIEFFIPFVLAFILALFPAVWAMAVPWLYRYLLVPVNVQLRGWDAEQGFDKPSRLKELLYALSLAALWAILEWVRSWIATGLPWNYLATTQWQNTPVLQICEYTGMYGVSFLVALVNIAGALAIRGWYRGFRTSKYQRPIVLIASVVLLMTSVLVGSRSMFHYRKHKGEIPFRAAVLQGDIPQCRNATTEQAEFALETYLKLSELAIISRPDLVVWPETAVPLPYRAGNTVCYKYRFEMKKLLQKADIPFLVGTIDFEDIPPGVQKTQEIYNTAILLRSDGKIKAKYDKVHIVPFGEFVPFADWFPVLVKWIGMGRGLSRGKTFDPIEVKPGVRAGINICFEDVFPYVSRNEAKAGANLLVTITNDAWYPKSDEPEQHLANSVFRCIETRLPMIRCGNNSCSVVIDETGVIRETMFSEQVETKYGTQEKLLPARRGQGMANFSVKVRKNPTPTFYTRFGDVFILFCWLIFGFAAAMALWAWREKKQALVDAFDDPQPAE